MSDIDLIPNSFRNSLLINRWLRQSGAVLMVTTLLVMGSWLWLRAETTNVEDELKTLQSQQEISTQQRSDLESLIERKQDLQQQLDLLAGLRSGVVAQQMFITMDRALTTDDVWFSNWRFRRAGTPTKETPDEKSTGYFVVITDKENQKEETWKIETHMTIQGGAIDHAALSRFVSSLIDRPEIQSVRVVRSELVRQSSRRQVNFTLEIVVSSSGEVRL